MSEIGIFKARNRAYKKFSQLSELSLNNDIPYEEGCKLREKRIVELKKYRFYTQLSIAISKQKQDGRCK